MGGLFDKDLPAQGVGRSCFVPSMRSSRSTSEYLHLARAESVAAEPA